MQTDPGAVTLRIEGLCHRYPGPVDALRDVHLTLSEGVFGLLGPNGAGKSTLMRIIATLQSPTAGAVRLGDLDVLGDPQAVRRQIGYLPQDFGVPPRVSAREMLDYIAGLKGVEGDRRAAVDAELARAHLSAVADRRLDTYSGGMRQRFGLATALLGKPRLIIVDEPTAGLDPVERRRFQRILAEAATDCILILSSHIVEDIAALCPRLAVLHDGRLVAQGETKSLIAALAGQVWAHPDERAMQALPNDAVVLSRRPYPDGVAVRVRAEGCPGAGFEAVEPDLEDVYAAQIGAPT